MKVKLTPAIRKLMAQIPPAPVLSAEGEPVVVPRAAVSAATLLRPKRERGEVAPFTVEIRQKGDLPDWAVALVRRRGSVRVIENGPLATSQLLRDSVP